MKVLVYSSSYQRRGKWEMPPFADILTFKLKANSYAQLNPPLEPQPPAEGAWLRLELEDSPGPEGPVLHEKLDIIF